MLKCSLSPEIGQAFQPYNNPANTSFKQAPATTSSCYNEGLSEHERQQQEQQQWFSTPNILEQIPFTKVWNTADSHHSDRFDLVIGLRTSQRHCNTNTVTTVTTCRGTRSTEPSGAVGAHHSATEPGTQGTHLCDAHAVLGLQNQEVLTVVRRSSIPILSRGSRGTPDLRF